MVLNCGLKSSSENIELCSGYGAIGRRGGFYSGSADELLWKPLGTPFRVRIPVSALVISPQWRLRTWYESPRPSDQPAISGKHSGGKRGSIGLVKPRKTDPSVAGAHRCPRAEPQNVGMAVELADAAMQRTRHVRIPVQTRSGAGRNNPGHRFPKKRQQRACRATRNFANSGSFASETISARIAN